MKPHENNGAAVYVGRASHASLARILYTLINKNFDSSLITKQ